MQLLCVLKDWSKALDDVENVEVVDVGILELCQI